MITDSFVVFIDSTQKRESEFLTITNCVACWRIFDRDIRDIAHVVWLWNVGLLKYFKIFHKMQFSCSRGSVATAYNKRQGNILHWLHPSWTNWNFCKPISLLVVTWSQLKQESNHNQYYIYIGWIYIFERLKASDEKNTTFVTHALCTKGDKRSSVCFGIEEEKAHLLSYQTSYSQIQLPQWPSRYSSGPCLWHQCLHVAAKAIQRAL